VAIRRLPRDRAGGEPVTPFCATIAESRCLVALLRSPQPFDTRFVAKGGDGSAVVSGALSRQGASLMSTRVATGGKVIVCSKLIIGRTLLIAIAAVLVVIRPRLVPITGCLISVRTRLIPLGVRRGRQSVLPDQVTPAGGTQGNPRHLAADVTRHFGQRRPSGSQTGSTAPCINCSAHAQPHSRAAQRRFIKWSSLTFSRDRYGSA